MKRTGKNKLKKTRTYVSFFDTQKTTRALVYSVLLSVENLRRSTSRTLFVTLEWIEFLFTSLRLLPVVVVVVVVVDNDDDFHMIISI